MIGSLQIAFHLQVVFALTPPPFLLRLLSDNFFVPCPKTLSMSEPILRPSDLSTAAATSRSVSLREQYADILGERSVGGGGACGHASTQKVDASDTPVANDDSLMAEPPAGSARTDKSYSVMGMLKGSRSRIIFVILVIVFGMLLYFGYRTLFAPPPRPPLPEMEDLENDIQMRIDEDGDENEDYEEEDRAGPDDGFEDDEETIDTVSDSQKVPVRRQPPANPPAPKRASSDPLYQLLDVTQHT